MARLQWALNLARRDLDTLTVGDWANLQREFLAFWAAENALARELTKRGAVGIAAYSILGDVDPKDEAKIKEGFEKAGAVGVVVLRPVGKEKEVYSTPSVYAGPYGTFWGGYYPGAWSGAQVHTNTIVIVETLVYSLRQNKLVWAGESRTTNPTNVDAFVHSRAGGGGGRGDEETRGDCQLSIGMW